ncbi:MAG: hypothetical protein M3Y82_00410 [Verrucomicrobiota bacterium]|nr:hypothetical protein [Verrucomicrobiota bacterium]
MDFYGACEFHQYAGISGCDYLQIHGGAYVLEGGTLNFAGSLSVNGTDGKSQFLQTGGTNSVSYVGLGSWGPFPISDADYFLGDGTLLTGSVWLGTRGGFTQNNGIMILTNLQINGFFYNRPRGDAIYGSRGYFLWNGVLSAASVYLNGKNATFSQQGGVAQISGSISSGGIDGWAVIELNGGRLTCSNVTSFGSGADIFQNGGSFVVTNNFAIGGYYGYDLNARFAQYHFSFGTLYASNIELAADMIIGSSTNVGRITNPGYFKMAGTLTSGDATEQLGRFILTSNATINLGDGNARLSFAQSSAEVWNGAAVLTVTNWSGSTNGGVDDQLKFGGSSSGLTTAQLRQIRFVNPAGFPPGANPAKILSTGEVVPAPRPIFSFTRQGTNLVLSWTTNFFLQTATNVSGPYEDLMAAISPYTNNLSASPQRYFRVRQ